MKRFIYKAIFFSLLIGFIAFILSDISDRGLKKSKQQEWASWNDIFSSNVSDSIVIFGGSRVHGGYNPRIIEDSLHLTCYNLGMNGYTIDLIYQRYNVLLKYNSIPKYILLNIDYLTTMEVSDWPYQMTQYLPYIQEPLFNEYFERVNFDWKKQYIPLFKYSDCVDKLFLGIGEFFSPSIMDRYKGFANNNNTFDGRGLREALNKKQPFKVCVEDNALNMCDDYILNCQKHGIDVIVVLAPHYYLVTENMVNKDALDEYLNSLYDRFSVPVLDYTNFGANDSTNFVNGTHLSQKGADSFTQQLSHDLHKYIY